MMDTAIVRADFNDDGGSDGLRPAPIWELPEVEALLAMLEPGQAIEFTAPGVDIAVAVLEGAGQVWVNDRLRTVRAGDVVLIPKASRRGMRAGVVRLLIFHAAVPAPGDPAIVHHRVRRQLGIWGTQADSSESGSESLAQAPQETDTARPLELAGVKGQTRRALRFLREGQQDPGGTGSEAQLESRLTSVLALLRTLTLDQRAIMQAIDELTDRADRLPRPDLGPAAGIRRSLSGLAATSRSQFDREQSALLPLFELLTGSDDV
jgi:hypothetical protein